MIKKVQTWETLQQWNGTLGGGAFVISSAEKKIRKMTEPAENMICKILLIRTQLLQLIDYLWTNLTLQDALTTFILRNPSHTALSRMSANAVCTAALQILLRDTLTLLIVPQICHIAIQATYYQNNINDMRRNTLGDKNGCKYISSTFTAQLLWNC